MCTFVNEAPPANGENQWVLDNPRMREFIGAIDAIRSKDIAPEAMLEQMRPHFTRLLADQDWLPAQYQEPFAGSGMGSGIGMWLLYRAGDGSLAFSTLVVPPGAETPVHDHLAWGLVGLYRGTQDEVVFTRSDDGSVDGKADLAVFQENHLVPGDMYDLLPAVDIHRVKTTSDVTSVSLHLLGIDNGCIVRHRFFPDEGTVADFKSGYVNSPCEATSAAD
jgi:predicted metal-dependent enzyme (double-stranded beta helix superfamily)